MGTQDPLDNQSNQPEPMPVLPFVIGGVASLISIVLLVLWMRYLYNAGAPKCD